MYPSCSIVSRDSNAKDCTCISILIRGSSCISIVNCVSNRNSVVSIAKCESKLRSKNSHGFPPVANVGRFL